MRKNQSACTRPAFRASILAPGTAAAFAVALFFVAGCASDPSGGAESGVRVHALPAPGNRIFEITVPAQWRMESEKAPEGVDSTNGSSYIFSPRKRDGDAFLLRVNLFRFAQYRRDQLLAMSRRVTQEAAKDSPQCQSGKPGTVHDLQGASGRGHYYQGGYKTKYGCDYKAAGDMVMDDLNVQFIFLYNKPGTAEEQAAMTAIRTAKLRTR
jgi:hypothetical protein